MYSRMTLARLVGTVGVAGLLTFSVVGPVAAQGTIHAATSAKHNSDHTRQLDQNASVRGGKNTTRVNAQPNQVRNGPNIRRHPARNGNDNGNGNNNDNRNQN